MSLLSRMRPALAAGERDRVLLAFAAALLLIWLGVQFRSVEIQETIYRFLGLSRDGMSSGKVWQILTHGLLHGPVWHMGINLIALAMLGQRLIWILGRRTFFLVLVFGTVAGGLVHLAWPVSGPHAVVLVGISGGICALLTTLTGIAPDARFWPLPISGQNITRGFLLAVFLLLLVDPYLGPLAGVISHGAHLGGLLTGVLYARYVLRSGPSLAELQRLRAEREES